MAGGSTSSTPDGADRKLGVPFEFVAPKHVCEDHTHRTKAERYLEEL
jgi:hypothetical protein